MLIVHLLFGFILGALAAVGSLLMGISVWGALAFYIVGGNLGVCLSIGAMVLLSTPRAPSARLSASIGS
jgi:hypothetical protein